MRLLEHCGLWAATRYKANAEASGCARRARGADGWRVGRGLSILSMCLLPDSQGDGRRSEAKWDASGGTQRGIAGTVDGCRE